MHACMYVCMYHLRWHIVFNAINNIMLLYVCIYVCMYACVTSSKVAHFVFNAINNIMLLHAYKNIHACIQIYIHTNIHTYKYTYTHTLGISNVDLFDVQRISIRMQGSWNAYKYTYMHTNIHAYKYAYPWHLQRQFVRRTKNQHQDAWLLKWSFLLGCPAWKKIVWVSMNEYHILVYNVQESASECIAAEIILPTLSFSDRTWRLARGHLQVT